MLTVQFFQSLIQLDIALFVAVAFNFAKSGDDGRDHRRLLPITTVAALFSIAVSLRALSHGLTEMLGVLAVGGTCLAFATLLGALTGTRVVQGLGRRGEAIGVAGLMVVIVAFCLIASPAVG